MWFSSSGGDTFFSRVPSHDLYLIELVSTTGSKDQFGPTVDTQQDQSFY